MNTWCGVCGGGPCSRCRGVSPVCRAGPTQPRDIPVRFPRPSSVPSRGPQSRAFSGVPRSFYWVLIRPHVRATFEICVIVERRVMRPCFSFQARSQGPPFRFLSVRCDGVECELCRVQRCAVLGLGQAGDGEVGPGRDAGWLLCAGDGDKRV